MPYDDCRDCTRHADDGAGFRGGRCPNCFTAFVDRRLAAALVTGPEDQAETAPRGRRP